jgi:hypothetical protein
MTIQHPGRLPFLAPAIISLAAATWAGLARLDLPVATPPGSLITNHGPLMVSGFLGTLIGLERAVALGRPWAYAAPLLSGAGALWVLFFADSFPGQVATTLGSLAVVAIFATLLSRGATLHTATMALGACAWLAGNLLWLRGSAVFRVVPVWACFLALTIAGERLELTRLLQRSRGRVASFVGAVTLLAAGSVLTPFDADWSWRLTGAGFLALAAWLLFCDVARRTVRQRGLPRFIALCLLSGYVWLGASGSLALASGEVSAGVRYDAVLHSFFLGFVLSMIFGHAPVIFPAILGREIGYRPAFYVHLVVLDLTLVLRIAGDLGAQPALRQVGGVGNAVALVLFLGVTIWSVARRRSRR